MAPPDQAIVSAIDSIRADGATRRDRAEVFAALAGSQVPVDALNTLLAELAGTGRVRVPAGGGRRFLLARVVGHTLTLGLLTPTSAPPEQLCSYPWHRWVAPLAGALTARIWRQPSAGPDDVLDRSRLLSAPIERRLDRGEAVELGAALDVADLVVDVPTPVLVLESPPLHPYFWEYDLASLAPVRLIAGSPSRSRLEYSALMLAEMGHREATEELVRLSKHPDHAIRWAAIRAVTRLDPTCGRRLLAHAAGDPHPQVRAASQRILAAIDRRRP